MFSRLWWLVQKDVVAEWRSRRTWPAMLLFGVVVALVFSFQLERLGEAKRELLGGLIWLATFFAGLVAVDRSFASEKENACLEALLLYPLPPWLVFVAKWFLNLVSLVVLQCVLVPLVVVLCDVPLELSRVGALVLVALLSDVGFAAVGTLLSLVSAGTKHGNGLLAVLVLPLLTPVVLAAGEATRLLLQNTAGQEWLKWLHLLAVFAVLFVGAGLFLFQLLTASD